MNYNKMKRIFISSWIFSRLTRKLGYILAGMKFCICKSSSKECLVSLEGERESGRILKPVAPTTWTIITIIATYIMLILRARFSIRSVFIPEVPQKKYGGNFLNSHSACDDRFPPLYTREVPRGCKNGW